jgi:undecaprenyl diphosphate synthase
MSSTVPVHVGIIMDGNGRWARKRGLKRIDGHTAAEKAIHEAVELCGEAGIGYLTLYAFSTENWNRPKAEVAFIMMLLRRFLSRNLEDLHGNNVRLRATGRLDRLPAQSRSDLLAGMEYTSENTGLNLILALNYGGRREVIDAVRKLSVKVARGEIEPDEIDESTISGELYNPDIPDPDLIIRTSGEMRLSNFLLWESAYSELWFTPVLWPDFRKEHLQEALDSFANRRRRFGGLDPGEGN